MGVPPALQQAIKQAHQELMEHPKHALRPYYRIGIYKAIRREGGEWADEVRGTLAVLTARHVLPIWQREQGGDLRPEHLLSIAEDVLQGRLTPAAGCAIAEHDAWLDDSERGSGGRRVDEPSTIEPPKPSLEAGLALEAAREALYDASRVFTFWTGEDDDLDVNEYTTDAYFDYTCTDTALWAAAAYAGGAEDCWEEAFDPAKSKEFWEWWLLEAIPQAWSEVVKT